MSQPNIRSASLPVVRGRYTENAPLGESGWFKCGGKAEVQFKPADLEDLQDFLKNCPPEVSVHVFGALSNTIIRDGGLPGVTIRLGREFAGIVANGETVQAGALALAAGAKEGEGIPDLAGRIKDLFQQTYRHRAETVARTEVISAYNGSARLAIDNQDADVVGGMEWISTADDQTRDAHADADGTIIGVGETFSIDGGLTGHTPHPARAKRDDEGQHDEPG
mgnify:CR=1 FL=1